jgi:hypothetical protein
MEFTDVQQDLIVAAWATARNGGGIVITDEAIPDAHELAEAGWLERRFQPDGEMSWHWTREAELALDVNALVESTHDRRN